MNKWPSIVSLTAALSGLPLAAFAVDMPAPAAGSTATPAPSQQDLEKQLEDARRQLSEAARRVADLSMQLNDADVGPGYIDLREHFDRAQRHGVLGVDLDSSSAAAAGVTVAGVTPGGPADKAGLHAGDEITAINGTAFKASGNDTAADKLVQFMGTVKPGDALKVAYTRGGKSDMAVVTAGNLRDLRYSMMGPMPPMPPMPPMAPEPPMDPHLPMRTMLAMPGFNSFFGMGRPWGEMQLVTMSPGLAQYFGTDKGLLVLHVPKDSALQLQDGDVIEAIGGRDPGLPPHAMRILSSYGPGENVKLDIMRKGKPQSLNVNLPKAKDKGDDSTNAFNFSFKLPDLGSDDGDDDDVDGR